MRGETRCANVGFFKRSGNPFVFDTNALHRGTGTAGYFQA